MSMDSVTELYAKAAYEGRSEAVPTQPREPSDMRSRIAISVLCLGFAINAALPAAALWALAGGAWLR